MAGNPSGGASSDASSSSGMSGLLGMLSSAGSKSKQPSTADILRMGMQMMQHPAQGAPPPMLFGQGGGLMGGQGMPQAPGAGLMGGGMPQGSPFQGQSGPPMTQFPRY